MAEAKFEHENRQIFWNNLLALSFEPKVAENKHRIEFNKDMFQKPNHKGFEVVMHFLFHKLDAPQAKVKFRDCYPVQDKKQDQLFRKACRDWLQIISQQNAALISLQQGLVYVLQNKGGRKFYKFLRDFSTYVLYEAVILEADCNELVFSLPSTLQESRKYCRTPNYELYNLGAALFSRSLINTRNKLQNQYKELESIGQSLTRTYRHFQQLVTGQLQYLQNTTEGVNISASSHFVESCEEVNLEPTEVYLKKNEVEGKWSLSEDSFQKERIAWEIFNNVIFKKRQMTILNKDSLAVTLPTIPFANCNASLEKNHKLSLAGMYSVGIVLLDQLCRSTDLGKLQRIAGKQLEISQIQLQVESLRSLKSKLDEEMIPSRKCFNTSLWNRLMETEMRSLSTLELGRELVCPTPPLRNFHFGTSEDTPSPYLSLRALPSNQLASAVRSGFSKKRAQLSRNRRTATTDCRQAQMVLTEEHSFDSVAFPEHEFGCGDTKRCDSHLLSMKRPSVRDLCDSSATRHFDIKGDVVDCTPSPANSKKFNATEELGLHVLDTPVSSVTHLHDNGSFLEPGFLMSLRTNPSLNEPCLTQRSECSTPVTVGLVLLDTSLGPTPPLPPRLQKMIQARNGMGNVPSDSDPEPLESLTISLVDSPSPLPQTPPYPPRIWKFLQEQTDKVADI